MSATEYVAVLSIGYALILTGLYFIVTADRDHWRTLARRRGLNVATLLNVLRSQGRVEVVDLTDLDRAETVDDVIAGWSK